MISDAEKQRLLAIATAEGANFIELVRIAGLDPSRAFRGADLRQVDFQGCDLNGFDFTDADLDGASFAGASLKGAIFDTRWETWTGRASEPSTQRTPKPASETVLTAYQQRLLDLMRAALTDSGRALALMPPATGRSAVLVELIAQAVPKDARAAVVVTSAAEREQMITRLRDRLPGRLVISSRDRLESAAWDGVVVHSASAYDEGFGALFQTSFLRLEFLFSTSLERAYRLMRAAQGQLGNVRMAVFETPLIDIGNRDFDRQNRLVREMFGQPQVELSVDEGLSSGQLVQANIVQPEIRAIIPPAITKFSSSERRANAEELLYHLSPVATELVDILHAMRPQSLLVLCRDASQAKLVSQLLRDRLPDGEGIRSVPPRWSGEKIRSELEAKGGIMVAPVSRHSLDAARPIHNVAVMTPMRLALAQELAFRPALPFTHGVPPLVIDFAGAFSGFPSVKTIMRTDLGTSPSARIVPGRNQP